MNKKIIIGLGIIEYAINLFFALIGYRTEGRSPILSPDQVISNMVDPLPQADLRQADLLPQVDPRQVDLPQVDPRQVDLPQVDLLRVDLLRAGREPPSPVRSLSLRPAPRR